MAVNEPSFSITNELGKEFFESRFRTSALNFVQRSKVNISFEKGSLDTYFIVSGIVSDGGHFEAKVKHKKDIGVTSNCSCLEWTEDKHCSHTAALYYQFHKNYNLKETLENRGVFSNEQAIHHLALQGKGVHTEEYGTIISSPSKLTGAHAGSTYSSLQYILLNKGVTTLPLPKPYQGDIQINFVPAKTIESLKLIPGMDDKFYPTFKLKDGDQTKEKISLFEHLYFFNWENGECFEINPRIKELIKHLKRKYYLLGKNEILELTTFLKENENLFLSIDDNIFTPEDSQDSEINIYITESKRKNFLTLSLEISENNVRLMPPAFFKMFCSENGFLESFRTKTDAARFIQTLLGSIKDDNREYLKAVYGSSKKEEITYLAKQMMHEESLYFISDKYPPFYQLAMKHVVIVMSKLIECFQESLTRFSRIDLDEKLVHFELPKSLIMDNVAPLYNHLNPHNVDIYYDEKKVKGWSSQIKFERHHGDLGWFDLDLVLTDEDLAIIRQAEIGNDIVSKDGELLIIDPDRKKLLKFMKRYTKFESDGEKEEGEFKKFHLNINRARIFELFELKKLGIEGALTSEEEQLCHDLLNLEKVPDYPIPECIQAELRDYQKEGYRWMRFLYENRFGACLADDMGLGKTLQTIVFLQSIIEKTKKILIVCPVSIIQNWENEINRFSDLKASLYYGTERTIDEDSKIIITSYGLLKREATETFKDMRFDVVIFDEVQQLKNIRSQGAHAARTLIADFRICLTGTPVENDLSEFTNIMDLTVPGVWGEMSFIRSSSSKKNRLLARQTVRPFIMRRTKSQVLKELPDKIENHVYLRFSDAEREAYVGELARIRNSFEVNKNQKKYGEVLKNLLKLRQLCLWQRRPGQIMSTKIDFLIETIKELHAEGHQAIIFSQFTTYLDLIEGHLKHEKFDFSRIDGSQPMAKRSVEVEKFQDGTNKIFLISLKAGGFGLNLTAASYIFLMDPWWNPAVESQAIDRAHRIGQENHLTVYRPIIKESIEEKVLVLQDQKRELFKDLMADDDREFFNGRLTMDDFKALLD